MVVVGAHDFPQHIVGKIGHRLGVGHVHRAGALHHQRLKLLGAHDGAQAGAGGVVAGVDQARVGHQVFARLADGGHAGAVALKPVQRLGRGTGALAPQKVGRLDFNVVVLDAQVHGRFAHALQNDAVISGLLDVGAQHAAGMGVNYLIVSGIGGQEANGGAACQGHTGCGEGPYGEHDLRLFGEGVGAGRNFVVHDFVGDAHAADVVFVRLGRLGGDGPGGQVNAENLARPSI